MLTKAKIVGIGGYLPSNILTNFDLEKTINTTDEWITKRTGISQRHIANKDELTSDMGVKAAINAIQMGNLSINDIDLIICSTTTPDLTFPSTASIIANKLNCTRQIPCFDVQAVCSGFIYALEVAHNMLQSTKYQNILIVSSEKNSSIVDWQDRSTCILFGDGAGAVVLSKNDNNNDLSDIIDIKISGDSSKYDILKTNGGVSTNGQSGHIMMQGQELFKYFVPILIDEIIDVLRKNNLNINDIDYLVMHQANARIIDYVIEKIGYPKERTILTIDQHANTSSASIPLALHECQKTNKIKRNNIVMMVAFGSGLTWGMALLRY